MKCNQLAPVQGCLLRVSGVHENVLIHYEYRNDVDGAAVLHAVRVTDALGVVLTVGVTDTLTPGACVIETQTKAITVQGGNFASGSQAANYDPDGNGDTWTAPVSGLQSFTVIVRGAGQYPVSADRVVVKTASGVYYLTQDQIRTWSVAQDASSDENLIDIVSVTGQGDSAFEVIWTMGG